MMRRCTPRSFEVVVGDLLSPVAFLRYSQCCIGNFLASRRSVRQDSDLALLTTLFSHTEVEVHPVDYTVIIR